ncbi:hypothetical protein N9X59_01065 [Alphaproteobacteria bacterium]|nr:hypothetical protein [Alphaproteobacteria bacterium]
MAIFTSALGLACQILIARKYGASSDMDAYLVSIAIPVFLATLITSACSYGLIPKLSAYDNNQKEFMRFSQAMFVLGIILAIFFMLMLLLAPFQVLYFSEFSSVDNKTLLVLFRVGWCIGACQILVAISAAILNAKSFYALSTSLAWFPYLGIIISLMFMNEVQSILHLSYGLLSGTVVALLISFMLLYKTLLSDFVDFLSKLPEYSAVIVTASIKAVIIGSIFTSYMVIDSYWAPMLGDGIMATLGYAQRILGSVGALSIMAVYVVTGREAQIELTSNGIGAFRQLSISFFKIASLLSVTLAIFLFMFIENIVELLFASKNFDNHDISALATTVKIMLPGMVCMLVSTILVKLILCLDNIGYIALGMGLLWPISYYAGISFLFDFGLIGLALSYSVAWFFLVIALSTSIFILTKEAMLVVEKPHEH